MVHWGIYSVSNKTAYISMAGISTVIRQFLLPNPFDKMTKSFIVYIGKIPLTLTPDILNWIAEPFLYVITFALVGCYYSKGFDSPVKGSFLYLLLYAIHVGLLSIIAYFNFSILAILFVLAGYVAFHIGYNLLKNRISGGI